MRNLIVIVLFSFVPFMIQGQVTVANATPGVIQVEGVSIPSKFTKPIQTAVKNGIVAVDVEYYEGLDRKGPVKFYLEVDKRNRAVIRNFDVNQELASQFKQISSEQSRSQTESPRARNVNSSVSGDWYSTVTVFPINKTEEYSIFVPIETFRGLALKPGQRSESSITLRTGDILIPVIMESVNEDGTPTGMSFTVGLIKTIITEGQEEFEFNLPEITVANSGKTITKRVVSDLSFDVIIPEGATRGQIIEANRMAKIELFVGWNILPVQYKDDKGYPKEAMLISLINESRAPIALKRSYNQVDIFELDEVSRK